MARSTQMWWLLASMTGAGLACDTAATDSFGEVEGEIERDAPTEVDEALGQAPCREVSLTLEATGVDVMLVIDEAAEVTAVREGVGDVVVAADEAHRFGVWLASAPADVGAETGELEAAEPAVPLQADAIGPVMAVLPRASDAGEVDGGGPADLAAGVTSALAHVHQSDDPRAVALVVVRGGLEDDPDLEDALDEARETGIAARQLDGNDAAGLRRGLSEVTQDLACRFEVPTLDTRSTRVHLAGQALPEVEDCATEDGWALRDHADGATLTLCGRACQLLDVAGHVDVESVCAAA